MGLSVLLTFLVYLPVLNNDFVNWDDPLYIQYNPMIRNIDRASLASYFDTSRANYWIPLTWFSLSMDYQLGRLNPSLYHMHSLLLHCVKGTSKY